jgi:mandelamide amidase
VALLDACAVGGLPADAGGEPAEMPHLGVPVGFLTEDLDHTVSGAWREACEQLRDSGLRLVEVEAPGLWELIDSTSPLITSVELRRDLPTQILPRTRGLSAVDFIAGIASADVRTLFERICLTLDGPSDAAYRQARDVLLPEMRELITAAFRRHRIQAWIFPTVPVAPFARDTGDTFLLNGTPRPTFLTAVRNLQQASLIGMPSLSLPMARSGSGLPVGLCIEGLPGQDRALLAVASRIERALASRRPFGISAV